MFFPLWNDVSCQITEEEMRRHRPPGFQTKAKREEVRVQYLCL